LLRKEARLEIVAMRNIDVRLLMTSFRRTACFNSLVCKQTIMLLRFNNMLVRMVTAVFASSECANH